MTGQSGAASDRAYETVTEETVAQKELDEIRYRRHEASTSGRAEVRVDLDSNEEIQNSLTGLAFSGGGIRSGAICLGVLKALRRTRLLWFFDYLSTVSGGGYAGAYLSSAALCTTRAGALKYESQKDETASEDGKSQSDEEPAKSVVTEDESHRVLKALHGEEKQSERMQDFIFGGHYLIRTRRFLNRYLMGTSLLWALTFSALASMALILSLMFRSMDSDGVRDWLAGLGFRTDIPRGLFPAFCLAVLWFTCWSISYFRDGSQAKGKRASYVLTLFFLAVGVAVAALLGNGEFGGISWLSANGSDGFFSEHLREVMRLALYGFIGVGLLPYLRPSKFIQSGAKPKKTSERVIFALSSRVLVYGVPFLLVSWFAMEDVSGWSKTRATPESMREAMRHAAMPQSKPTNDSDKEKSGTNPGQNHRQEIIALAHAEVEDWKSRSPAWAPLWSQLRHTHDSFEKKAAEKESKQKSSDGQSEADDKKPHPGVFIWQQIQHRPIYCEHNGQGIDTVEEAIDSLHEKLELSRRLFSRSRNGKSNTMVERVARRSYALATYLPDWWRSSAETWQSVPTTFDNGPRNPIRQLANLRQNIRDIKEAITAHFEYQLKTALLSECDWQLRVEELEAESNKEAATQLSATILKAEHFYQAHDLHRFDKSTANWTAESWLKLALINRELVAAAWPGTITTDPDVVFASAVQAPDQAWRFNWLLCSLAVFAFLALVVNVNAAGLHGFYSRGLAENWIEPVPGIGRQIPIARLATTSEGLPYHLIMASVHWLGRKNKQSGDLQRDSFLFSKLFCGCRKSGYVDSKDYMEGDITLPDAIAVSGAAVSPVQQGNPLVKALLWLANVRLGQWLENPRVARLRTFTQFIDRRTITPLRLLASIWRRAEDRPHYFVSDGGHHENLGVGVLFKRRCRFMLAIDASQDQEYEFSDLATLIRWARVKHGVVLEPVHLQLPDETADGITQWNQLSPKDSSTRLAQSRLADRHFVLLRVLYSDCPDDVSWLVYVKASLTGDEPVDLIRYAERDEDFPHNSTADQFYDPDQFESYRQLGEHLTEAVIRELPATIRDQRAGKTKRPYLDALVRRMEECVADGRKRDVEIDNEVKQTADTLENQSERIELREQAANSLSHHLDRRMAVRSLLNVLGDSDEALANLALNILREIRPELMPVLYEVGHGVNDSRAVVREQTCHLLADLLRVIQPASPIVARLIEIGRGGRSVRKGEQRAALFALRVCRTRIADEEQRQAVENLVASSSESSSSASSDA